MTPPLPCLLVVPTGIGCDQGGYAGDALPVARLLAAASGCLITHPNVVNGASLYWSDPRLQYVEGWSLDAFARGELLLRPCRRQRLGLLLDAAIEPDLALRHRQVFDAAGATLGLDTGPVLVSDGPVGVELAPAASGSSWGRLRDPGVLLRAGERLREAGATAIAVVARFPDDPGSETLSAYRQGSGVDALAGAEALISHLLVRHLSLPCAHAPALAPLPPLPSLDPRAAAEELGHTFLPCVLVGLSRAPHLVPPAAARAGVKVRLVVSHVSPSLTVFAVRGEDHRARPLPTLSSRVPASFQSPMRSHWPSSWPHGPLLRRVQWTRATNLRDWFRAVKELVQPWAVRVWRPDPPD